MSLAAEFRGARRWSGTSKSSCLKLDSSVSIFRVIRPFGHQPRHAGAILLRGSQLLRLSLKKVTYAKGEYY